MTTDSQRCASIVPEESWYCVYDEDSLDDPDEGYALCHCCSIGAADGAP